MTENLIFSRKKVLYSRYGERSSVVEQRFVVPLAVGSIPIVRPTNDKNESAPLWGVFSFICAKQYGIEPRGFECE